MSDDDTALPPHVDALMWRLWEAAQDGLSHEDDREGPTDPREELAAVLQQVRETVSTADQRLALQAAEQLGEESVAGMELELAKARRALAVLRDDPSSIMRSMMRTEK